jgi:hypothetical protein
LEVISGCAERPGLYLRECSEIGNGGERLRPALYNPLGDDGGYRQCDGARQLRLANSFFSHFIQTTELACFRHFPATLLYKTNEISCIRKVILECQSHFIARICPDQNDIAIRK